METRSLPERFEEGLKGLSPFDQAKKICVRLDDAGKELRRKLPKNDTEKALNEYDAYACEKGVDMLYKLALEVERLRLSILHYDHGMMDRRDLVKATKNWNGDKISETE